MNVVYSWGNPSQRSFNCDCFKSHRPFSWCFVHIVFCLELAAVLLFMVVGVSSPKNNFPEFIRLVPKAHIFCLSSLIMNFQVSNALDLSSLDGSNGFVLNGIDSNDNAGICVKNIGDINGDGYDDVIIGAWTADPNGKAEAGESYVVFGGSNVGSGGSLDLSALNGSNGFVLNGITADDRSGYAVSGAGDFNGDGYPDFIVGAFRASPNGMLNAGESYVVFGGSNVGKNGTMELSALNGSDGFILNGIDANDKSGASVSTAGDFNGDGYSDIIIAGLLGDPNGMSNAGESYVVFGGSNVGKNGTMELSALNGSDGFVLNGVTAGDFCERVSNAGDVNGDGYDDVIIGFTDADPNGNSAAGESYVVFGGSNVGISGSIELSDLDGSNGFVLKGIDAGDESGYQVSGGGDFNGDGFDDIIIGAYLADANNKSEAGESYIVFGGVNVGIFGSLKLNALKGHNGFVLNGIDAGDESGKGASNAGDINGDGYDDILIGSPGADPNGISNAGESYVMFGGSNLGRNRTVELSALNGSNGFVLNGISAGDASGYSVSSAGDFNGDGFDDIIIGAYLTTTGQSYILFGYETPTSIPTPTDQPSSVPTTPLPTILPTICEDASPYCQVVTDFCATSFCPTCPQAHYCDVSCHFADCSSPTPLPSLMPTPAPTYVPSLLPTTSPTSTPSPLPTLVPSYAPTIEPSHEPTILPTVKPTHSPTVVPTLIPTVNCIGTEAALYTLTLFDSGGDGWNGTLLELTTSSNTSTLLSTTLSTGYLNRQKICLPSGCYYIVVNATDPKISWNLKDQNNMVREGFAPSSIEFCTKNGTFFRNETLSPTTSVLPSLIPTLSPTNTPIPIPSSIPTIPPSGSPTWQPSSIPSAISTIPPSGSPTWLPSSTPSYIPTNVPTENCVDGEYLSITSFGASCVDCEPGRYSVVADAMNRYPTSCSWCPIGYYSRTGASSCIACAEGKFSNADRSDCVQCQSGQFVNTTVQRCFNCTAGKYAPVALNQCVDCVAGSVTGVDSGAIVCDSCSPGTYSIGDGAINSCVNCSAGFYSRTRADKCIGCDEGTFAARKQSSSCQGCDAGKSTLGLKNATKCSNCLAGFYSATRASTCIACPIGHYADSKGTANCRACAAGSFTNQQKSQNCTLCPTGQYQEATGRSSCDDCDVNRYASQMSSKYCEQCEEGFASLQGSSQCDRCVEKYFWAYTKQDQSWGCEPCPYGATCAGGLYQPSPKNGFWIDRKGALVDPSLIRNVYECSRDNCAKLSTTPKDRRLETALVSSCLLLKNFSSTQCSAEIFCDEGSHGPLCGACDTDWSYNSQDQSCARCDVDSTWMQALVVIGAGLCFAMLLWYIRKGTIYIPPILRPLNQGKSKIRIPFLGMLSLIDSGSLKILWATIQIILSVSWNLNVTFPDPYNQVSKWLSFVQLDFINLKCLRGSYFLSVYISCAFPILLAILIWCSYAIRCSYQKCMVGKDNVKFKKLTNETIYASLVVVYLFLPPVAAIQFRALLCVELEDGQRYLRADTDVDCNSDSYNLFTLVNGCMITVYQALPLIYLGLLYRVREKLNPIHFSGKTDRAFRVRDFDKSLDPFRFLFDDYKLSRWYFEVVDLYRRILFTGILPLIAKDTAIVAYLGASLGILSAIYFRESVPYRVEFTNIIAVIAQYSILLVFMAALMIETDSLDLLNLSDFALGLILVAVTSLVLVFTVIGSFIRYKTDGVVNAYEASTRHIHIEWACNFSADKFQTTFDFVINRNVYDTHVLVYYYTSMVEAKAICKFGGLPALELDSRLCLDTHHSEFVGDRGGVVVSLKGPQHLRLGDPSLELMNPLSSTREAVLCLSLPCELLWKLKASASSTNPHQGKGNVEMDEGMQSISSLTHLRCLPSEVLDAMLPYEARYVEEIKSRIALEKNLSSQGRSNPILFSANILRAYQLKDDVELVNKGLTYDDHNNNTLSSKISKKKVFVAHPNTCKQYCEHLKRSRDAISKLGLVPLYTFVSPTISSDLGMYGIMLPTDQVGVYFSVKGPCSLGLGTQNFMENVIEHMFGNDQIDKFEGRGFLDLLIVYGAAPSCLEKSPEKQNLFMFGADRFEEFSKPNSRDGNYYLRPDRIFAALHLKELLNMDLRKEDQLMFNKEIENDVNTGQLLHKLEQEVLGNGLSIMLNQKNNLLEKEVVESNLDVEFV